MHLDIFSVAFAIGGVLFIGYSSLVMMTGTLYRRKTYGSRKLLQEISDAGKPKVMAITFNNSPIGFSFEVGLYLLLGIALVTIAFVKDAPKETLQQLFVMFIIFGIPLSSYLVNLLMKLKQSKIKDVDEIEYWEKKVLEERSQRNEN